MFFCIGEKEGSFRQPCSGADVSERSISLCSCGASHIRPTAFCSIAAGECSIAAGVYGIRQLQNGQLRGARAGALLADHLLLGNYCDV